MAATAAATAMTSGPQQRPYSAAAPQQPAAASAAGSSVAAPSCRNVSGQWSRKINTFHIEYANDASAFPGAYLSGSTLNAVVVLDINNPMSIVRIVFRCEGFLNIGDKKQTLISEVKTLFGHETGRRCAAKKPAGQYRFPVSLYLPEDLPSTVFEGRTIHVRYVCQAVLCSRAAGSDVVMERPFAVQHCNSQVLDEVIQSQSAQHHRTEFSGMSAIISLNRTGFYVGDLVSVTGTITNNNRNSRKVCVGLELIRSVVGHAEYSFFGSPRVLEKKKVSRVANRQGDFAKIPQGSTQPFAVSMDLHNVEPTERHRLVTMEYVLHVTFVTKHGLLGVSAPKYATFAITISPNMHPAGALQLVGLQPGSEAERDALHRGEGEASRTPAAVSDRRSIAPAAALGDHESGDQPPSYDSVVHKVL